MSHIALFFVCLSVLSMYLFLPATSLKVLKTENSRLLLLLFTYGQDLRSNGQSSRSQGPMIRIKCAKLKSGCKCDVQLLWRFSPYPDAERNNFIQCMITEIIQNLIANFRCYIAVIRLTNMSTWGVDIIL